ncbi:MAG TPA: sigma-70 family RNA polymerase sigma factor [Flavitalea sp.]|nr:sigma-70 family RNA polymerase sigma factor [Flavitalea sp.]
MTFIKNIQDEGVPDKELIARYKLDRDINIVALLFQRYMDLLFGVCLKYFKEPERSKDAVMQIFEELLVKVEKHEIDNFKGWLYTLAKNHCLMQLRSPKNVKTSEFNADNMHYGEELHLTSVMEKEAEFARMEKCLETLSPDQEKTVRLFYLENKCYKDISEETGIEWNKVRSFIQNGRRNLKICMEKTLNAENITISKHPGQ